MIYQNTEQFMMAFSHDEVVHGKCSMLLKMAADHIPDKARQLRALYAWMWGWPGKKTLFMGGEFGAVRRMGLRQEPRLASAPIPRPRGRALARRRLEPVLSPSTPSCPQSDYDHQSFQWVNNNDGNNSVISFVRHGTKPDESCSSSPT